MRKKYKENREPACYEGGFAIEGGGGSVYNDHVLSAYHFNNYFGGFHMRYDAPEYSYF